MLLLRLDDDTLDLSDYTNNGVYVAKVDIGAPAVREVTYDEPDRDGTLDQTAFVGARLITLSGQVIASTAAGTRQEILDRLQRFCRPGTRPTLTIALNDDVPRTIGLRPDQCASPIEQPGRCPFAASWKAPDPRFYAADSDGDPVVESVTVFPPASSSQGRAYNLAFNRQYPSAWGGSGFATVDVAGSAPTWPRHRIDGPATNPWITTTDTAGNTTRIDFASLTLAIGEYVDIDTAARTVYLNGEAGADRYSTLDFTLTRWGPLVPGTPTTIAFNADAFASPAKLTTTWQPAYL